MSGYSFSLDDLEALNVPRARRCRKIPGEYCCSCTSSLATSPQISPVPEPSYDIPDEPFLSGDRSDELLGAGTSAFGEGTEAYEQEITFPEPEEDHQPSPREAETSLFHAEDACHRDMDLSDEQGDEHHYNSDGSDVGNEAPSSEPPSSGDEAEQDRGEEGSDGKREEDEGEEDDDQEPGKDEDGSDPESPKSSDSTKSVVSNGPGVGSGGSGNMPPDPFYSRHYHISPGTYGPAESPRVAPEPPPLSDGGLLSPPSERDVSPHDEDLAALGHWANDIGATNELDDYKRG